jgi:hypothetical protein
MNTPKFRDSRGRLTAYAFHCGYKETSDRGRYTTWLYYEGAVYHAGVRYYDPLRKVIWAAARTLKDARRELATMVQS